nr:hypothetical protein [Tanacetum cinerariifolium]
MALTFADTHNIIAFLTKSDVSEGFDQIIDFLNGSTIQYALTVNPNICVSIIKQFWFSVAVKKVNDLTRLQALVDRKKVLITEETVREALRLDDAESIDCLPNEEIFAELARMGYEKPSTKLTFYKAFFSSQWKFLIYTILQCMSAKRTTWNEFSSSMASAVICLSAGRKFNFSKYIFDSLQAGEGVVEVNVDDVPDAGVANEGTDAVNVDGVTVADAKSSILSPPPTTQLPPPSQEQEQHFTSQDLEQDKIAQALEITKLKQRVKKLEMRNKLKVSKLRRLKKGRPTESQAQIYQIDLEHTDKLMTKVVTAAATITTIATAAALTLTTAPSAARRRKGVVIRDQKDTATPSIIIHSEPKSKDKGKEIMVHEPKPLKKKTQMEKDEAYARELKAELNKNKFNSNVAFLEKTKEQMEEEDSRALKRKVESSEDKAAKKHKLDEEVEELRKHLQIVPNGDNDVYTEATPLALKVPVVDNKIYTKHNKPYYKIKRANGSHQLYLSFLSMLRNFDIEDLEVLWELVKESFASSKPKNFSDDVLLTILEAMFEKPNAQAQI